MLFRYLYYDFHILERRFYVNSENLISAFLAPPSPEKKIGKLPGASYTAISPVHSSHHLMRATWRHGVILSGIGTIGSAKRQGISVVHSRALSK
jgi:hypothetical protein